MWPEWIQKRGFKYPDETIVRFIAKNYPDIANRNKVKVLIDGFASGRHVICFAKEGFDTYGIDLEEEAINSCQRWLDLEGLNAQIQRANALALPLDSDFFDIVVDFGMIEHFSVADRHKAFSEVSRVLKTGGIFVYIAKCSEDHYYKQGDEIEPDTFVLNTYFLQEMPTHFYDQNGIVSELEKYFSRIELEKSVHYRDNLQVKLSNWYAFACK